MEFLIETIALIIAAVVALLVGRRQFKARKLRDATNQKTQVLTSAHEEPLTQSEIKFLKKKTNKKMAGIIFPTLLWFGIYLVSADFFFPHWFGQYSPYLFWISSVALFSIGAYLFLRHFFKLRRDIAIGKKLVVTGNLTHWEHHPHSEDDYVLFVNGYSFRVNPVLFKKYAVGDALEVHLFEAWSNVVLFDRKL